ncbi:MAG TPA: hypothetical protein VFN35_10100, partial [Ktedonobacteraceae bacterium]|nr:hypothetical protein [Ktedonobacteraceae bacterium]
PWAPDGTHIILVTGSGPDGNLLVRDSANVTDLSNPNSLRPGPRLYNANRLELVSATVVVPPWRPRPASTTPPEADMQIPANWNDDGTTLSAPNGIKVSGAFRTYILSHPWESADVPLGPAQNADPVELGWQQTDGNNAGLRLICMYSELCYTVKRGVYRASLGREFLTLLNQQSIPQPPPNTPAPGATLDELRAAARLIGDTSTQMLNQLNEIQ